MVEDVQIGIAQCDITPEDPIWLVGYGDRNRKSEGIYQRLRAGAIHIRGTEQTALIITADLIGYDLEFAAKTKAVISESTGLLPEEIVLSATHTHCAPFFYPWVMPGAPDKTYADRLTIDLVSVSLSAIDSTQPGKMFFSRHRSSFGVNRRRPNNKGGVEFAPHPEGKIDRDLDTLWLVDKTNKNLGTLTFFGCHPTSLGGYLIGGDYPGYLCRELEKETGEPALFATGCAGDIRPWYPSDDGGFSRPTFEQLEAAGQQLAKEVLLSRQHRREVKASDLRITRTFNKLPYTNLPTQNSLNVTAASDDIRLREWAEIMQSHIENGPLPDYCPQEIQLLRLDADHQVFFLGGEILAEIGLQIKKSFAPLTTITCAYANGLIGYVPNESTYDLGGYEVCGSHHLFRRPAPFHRTVEKLIVDKTQALSKSITH